MTMIYLPVKFEFDWTHTVLKLESGNRNFEGQTNGQKTDKNMELDQFRREPSYDGDLSPCQV